MQVLTQVKSKKSSDDKEDTDEQNAPKGRRIHFWLLLPSSYMASWPEIETQRDD